jgi:myo-inositol-1(or 4)-monophosphatase
MLKECGFRPEIEAAAEAALLVGGKLRNGFWPRTKQQKKSKAFGTSTVMPADRGAQADIISRLRGEFPNALFVGEETDETAQPSIEEIFQTEVVYFVDGLDGTTEYGTYLPNYASSIWVMTHGFHRGGAIFGPDVFRGFLIVSDEHQGVFLWEHGDLKPKVVCAQKDRPEKPVIVLGLDVQRRREEFLGFIAALPQELCPRSIGQACSLSLAFVAAGRYTAMVQSPQTVWDWAAGIPAVITAGGKVRYYIVQERRVVPVATPPRTCYTAEKTLGFIAGQPDVVDELFGVLVENYDKK